MLAIIHSYIWSELSQQIVSQLSTADDRSYGLKFSRSHRQQQSLLGRCLLRGLLALKTATNADHWTIISNADSGLSLSHPDYHSPVYGSISHSQDMVVAALSDFGLIGVDVEAINPARDMEKLLNCMKQVKSTDMPSNTYDQYRLWTMFEAYYKARSPLADYLIPDAMLQAMRHVNNAGVSEMTIDNTQCFFKTMPLKGFSLTTCLLVSEPENPAHQSANAKEKGRRAERNGLVS